MNLFEILTTGADISQFINLSKNIQDEKLFKKILDNQEIIINLLNNNIKKEINFMKLIKTIVTQIQMEIDAAEDYAESAVEMKDKDTTLKEMYIKLANAELEHVDILHNAVVRIIDKHRMEKGEPPKEMMAIWEWEHEKQIEEVIEIKMMIEHAKK